MNHEKFGISVIALLPSIIIVLFDRVMDLSLKVLHESMSVHKHTDMERHPNILCSLHLLKIEGFDQEKQCINAFGHFQRG